MTILVQEAIKNIEQAIEYISGLADDMDREFLLSPIKDAYDRLYRFEVSEEIDELIGE